MKMIVESTPDRISDQYDKLTSPQGSKLKFTPGVDNPHSTEEMWVTALDKLELIRQRHREAEVFLIWFEPVWLALTVQERLLLDTYKYSDTRNEVVLTELAYELNFSVRQLFRRRKKALLRLSTLLFGV